MYTENIGIKFHYISCQLSANVQDKLRTAFPDATHHMILLVSVVGVHTGIGCQAIQYFKRVD